MLRSVRIPSDERVVGSSPRHSKDADLVAIGGNLVVYVGEGQKGVVVTPHPECGQC